LPVREECFFQLLNVIHDERPVLSNRFTDRHSLEKEKQSSFAPVPDRDGTIGFNIDVRITPMTFSSWAASP